MIASKIRPSSSTFPSEPPSIDASEALWAAQELAVLIEKLGEGSPVAMVLRHARREIASLMSAPAEGTVVGPFRIAA